MTKRNTGVCLRRVGRELGAAGRGDELQRWAGEVPVVRQVVNRAAEAEAHLAAAHAAGRQLFAADDEHLVRIAMSAVHNFVHA